MTTRASKRIPKQLDPPSLDDDPAERKRQLNVLAQRRYRQRKREHLQRLEESATSHHPPPTVNEFAELAPATSMSEIVVSSASTTSYTAEDFSVIQMASLDWPDVDEQISLDSNTGITYCFDSSFDSGFDTALDFAMPLLSTSSELSSVRSISSPASSSNQSHKQSLSRDELHLPTLQLTLLRGVMTIAKRLQMDDLIWDLTAQSPFYLGRDTVSLSKYLNLPRNLRPTTTQLSTPHHPSFDLLPWPDVRDKLIMVFSQPVEFRPVNARSPTAFIEFISDFEDSAEGVRIWGDDPIDESNWEVGEMLYNKWWWVLTRNVVTQANIWRGMRGARLLGDTR